jgi:hypothetical protein
MLAMLVVASIGALAAVVVLAPRAARAAYVRTTVRYRPPPATAVAATAAVGTTVRSLPPSCTQVVVTGAVYKRCGNTWYEPRYAASDITYVAVKPPR